MNRFFIPAACLALPLLAVALQWPVGEVLLTATFGETRADHFHNGIDLGREGQEVRPVADGEMVYRLDEAEHPLTELLGNGNLAILQHDDGSRSYYYHLMTGSLVTDRTRFTVADAFARSGNTGRSRGGHLHLSVISNGEMVNPLALLPPVADGKKPQIQALLFLTGDNLITLQPKTKLLGVDRFEFLVSAWDTYEKIERIAVLGIYKMEFYIDDRPVRTILFDRLVPKDGRLVLASGDSFEEVFSRSGFYRGGSYRNIIGQHRFKVKAWDFAGNMAEKEAEVTFR
jgi:hypothetical protein